MKNLKTYTLNNGIQLIHQPSTTDAAYLGVIINTGTRDEKPTEHGLAHFTEHCLFKGTRKRNYINIINCLDSVGGELNAYTSKEYTCIHAAFLFHHYEKAFDLISDIFFQSIFPEKELKKEKEIIQDEINYYLDTPSEHIFDEFEELIFPHHSLGHNILGKTENLKKFTSKLTSNFVARNYFSGELIIFSSGKIKEEELLAFAKKYFDKKIFKPGIKPRISPDAYLPVKKTIEKKTNQAHCIIGTRAYNLYHTKRNTLHLINNLLGGNAMNSTLNLSLREKHGLTYHIESNYLPYTDSGIFLIYFGCDKKNLTASRELIYKELNKLKIKKIKSTHLAQIKEQIKGQIALASEHKENFMISAAKNMLYYKKTINLKELYSRVDSVTATDIMETANKLFIQDNLSELTYL